LVTDKIIKKLNKEYAGEDCPTDVLAFDISQAKDKKNMLADIIISTDAAIRNARVFKTVPLYELYLYIVHGCLHLLGYRDKTTAQRNIMQEKTQKVMNSIHNT
jgi:probable rRNA maturation factor